MDFDFTVISMRVISESRLAVVASLEVQVASAESTGRANQITVVVVFQRAPRNDNFTCELVVCLPVRIDCESLVSARCVKQISIHPFAIRAGEHFPEWTMVLIENLQNDSAF